MIHKWLEEGYDTFLFLMIQFGSLLFFLLYWKGEYQLRYAEAVMQNFLTEVTVDGMISIENQEKLVQNLERINPEYEVELYCTEYVAQPVYALLPEDTLRKYYAERNVKKAVEFSQYEVKVEEEQAEQLQLQQETNATILAAVQKDFVSLPGENTGWSVEAVRPQQEVYKGERLITLCRVESEKGIYYAEAEPMAAELSGITQLKLWIEGIRYLVPVEIKCHPRTVVCSNGHEVVNSVSVLVESKEKGEVVCPYCAVLPKEISCSREVLTRKTGTGLKKEELWIKVTYLDGHEEKITPDSDEWQDSYDGNYCGIQQVKIVYRGIEDVVTVIAENEYCQECGGTCNERYYTDYKSFPYCTECMSKVPLFTGRIYEEERVMATAELVYLIDIYGEKDLHRGDFVKLQLYKRGKPLSALQKRVLQNGKVR